MFDICIQNLSFPLPHQEQGDVKLHVQEGLGLLAEAYKKIGDGFDRQILEAILKTHITKVICKVGHFVKMTQIFLKTRFEIVYLFTVCQMIVWAADS